MTSLADVFVAVKPDLKDFGPQVKREIPRHFDGRRIGVGMSKSLGGGFRAGIAGTARTMFAPIAAAAAAVGGFSLFKTFIDDAAESAKLGRLTAQVIKTTGGAANITAAQVDKLATSLSNKAGVDDELVQTGANLLLTFKNVRNETGKGNDIFNQATAAALDLSAAGFGSVESASKMLGKALNDPIKGLTALGRAGVTFTEQQKEQIAALVESGDVLGAQRIIMQEIASQVGGAAQAAASPMQRLGVIAGNIGEAFGTKLLPLIEEASVWIGEHLPGAFDTAMRIGGQLWNSFETNALPTLKDIAGFIKDDVIPALVNVGQFLNDNRMAVIAATIAWGALLVVTKAHAAVLAVQAAGGLVAYIKQIKIVTSVTKVWTAVQWAMNAALTANPIGLVIAAIAALAAGIIYAYKHSETFRKIVDGAFDFIADSADSFWNGFLKPILKGWINLWLEVVDAILTGAEAAFGWVPGLGDKLDDAHDAFEKFKRDVNDTLDGINDEAIKINVKTYGNLEFGGAGGRGGVGISMATGGRGGAGVLPAPRIPREIDAVGGDLDIKTLGLDPNKIRGFATDFLAQTKSAAQKQIEKLFQSGQATSLGRFFFPLPRGSYRVGVPINGYPGHTGQDFPAPIGTPVYAPFSGLLSQRNLGNRSYGMYSNITSGPWRSIQAHLSRFARSSGFVRMGQLVGFVGSTGNSTGPHLHQEFRRNNAVVNPRSVLSYDRGGFLPPGVSVVHNGTGQPEPVRPANMPMDLSDRTIDRLARVMLAGMGAVQRGSAQTAGLYSRGG